MVVVLPSPAGVGLIAVTSTSLPFGRSACWAIQSQIELGDVAAVVDAAPSSGMPRPRRHVVGGRRRRRAGDLDVGGHRCSPV